MITFDNLIMKIGIALRVTHELVSEQCQADDTVTFEISRAGNSQAELALEGELAPPNSGSGR